MIIKIAIAENDVHAAGANIREEFFGGFLVVIVDDSNVRIAFVFGTIELAKTVAIVRFLPALREDHAQ